MKNILLSTIFLLSLFSTFKAIAQENEEEEKKHLISVSLGYAYIHKGASEGSESADGVLVPSLGLNYFYELSPKWEIGLMTDFEFGSYIIFEKDLKRENAFIAAAVASYSLTKSWRFLAGGGIEFEKEKNLGIVRLGTEYNFNLKNNWLISPEILYDIKEGFDTWSFSVVFTKKF